MEESFHRKPKAWVAVLLALFAQPLALLYVRRAGLALLFLLASIVVAILGFVGGAADWIVALASWAIVLAAAVLAYRIARTTPEALAPWYSRWYSLSAFFTVFVVAVMVLRIFLYEPFLIPSMAMMPTLELKSRIIVQKYGFGHYSTWGMDFGRGPRTVALDRGDIVVFDYPRDPAQTYIKRLVGLPGDRIQYRGKNLVVNGVQTRGSKLDDYLHGEPPKYFNRYANKLDAARFDTLEHPDWPAEYEGAWQFPMKEQCSRITDGVECVIPAGHYFMMGDNRDNSSDSRYWGFVREDQIIGRLVATFK